MTGHELLPFWEWRTSKFITAVWDQNLCGAVWATAGSYGRFLHISRATISLKLFLRPADEWQEPGIITNNDYYYSENRAWNEPSRANTSCMAIHIHSTSSHSHFFLFRGYNPFLSTAAIVPQNLRAAPLLHFFPYTLFLSPSPTVFNHWVCNVYNKLKEKN